MRALEVTRYGGPEVLEWREAPDPVPGAGEVLVRVRAFAVNWADLLEREGRYPGQASAPFVSGHDLMGEVVALGPGVDAPAAGTRVFATGPHVGAAAELAAVPAACAIPAPEALGDVAAAALGAPYLTGELAIRVLGRLAPGDSVLIHAAAGALGSACLQLCRAYGAGTIVATAGSQEKIERVREWGADVAVDYTRDDFVPAVLAATGGKGVDVAIDSVGGDVLGATFDCVAPGGRLVCLGASSGASTKRFRLQTLFEKGISVAGYTLGLWIAAGVPEVTAGAQRVCELAARGLIDPVIARVFPAEDAAEAHRFLAGRRAIGRVVVALDPALLEAAA